MNVQKLLDKISLLPTEPSNVPEAPPAELVAFVVRWNRDLRQWKKTTLADFAGVSVSTVERVERGKRVRKEALDKIAEGLGYEPGYFTAPRLRIGTNEAIASFMDTFGNMEAVSVAPMRTHRAIREASQCQAFLIHRPDVPEAFDADLDNLCEWLDLASFVLSEADRKLPPAERGRRDLYEDILACVHELERRGLTILSGVMNAPQHGLPDCKVAIISVTPKLTDPGASKRRYVIVDRRVVAFPRSGWDEEGPS
ncbi:MAG: helix-turn-helix domain-containing protein [Alphaproteobacteria bacterium]|nr:helix-turn-helix domain-containing protein [Alphaproteobacteria bacterium]MBM3625813.1 helix-turn-helix domain-containing protein [Alphaproteobacteria bacterium]